MHKEYGDNLRPGFIKFDPLSVKHMEKRVEYHSYHRDGYTPCKYMHKE